MECPLGGRWRKITVMTSSRKKIGATGYGKAARWKSQKADFPTSLGNPAKSAGLPLSHSPDGYGRLTKIEHSLFDEKGTLLMS
jgi:hypothetical protein